MTAIATTNDGQHLISGGGEGQVRVWVVSAVKQRMEEAMKEHKGNRGIKLQDVNVKDDVKGGVLGPYMDMPRHFDAIFTSSLTFTS